MGWMKLLMIPVWLFSTFGCTHQQYTKRFPFPSPNVSVSNSMIYCDGKPFAELKKYLDRDFQSENSEDQRAQGLVLRYLKGDHEVWIHPKEGISLAKDGVTYTRINDLNKFWNSTERRRVIPYIGSREMRKEDAIRSIVYDVKISPDGKYVYYRSQGMLLDSSHRFSVEDGN
jgi:hypothetical protein